MIANKRKLFFIVLSIHLPSDRLSYPSFMTSSWLELKTTSRTQVDHFCWCLEERTEVILKSGWWNDFLLYAQSTLKRGNKLVLD